MSRPNENRPNEKGIMELMNKGLEIEFDETTEDDLNTRDDGEDTDTEDDYSSDGIYDPAYGVPISILDQTRVPTGCRYLIFLAPAIFWLNILAGIFGVAIYLMITNKVFGNQSMQNSSVIGLLLAIMGCSVGFFIFGYPGIKLISRYCWFQENVDYYSAATKRAGRLLAMATTFGVATDILALTILGKYTSNLLGAIMGSANVNSGLIGTMLAVAAVLAICLLLHFGVAIASFILIFEGHIMGSKTRTVHRDKEEAATFQFARQMGDAEDDDSPLIRSLDENPGVIITLSLVVLYVGIAFLAEAAGKSGA